MAPDSTGRNSDDDRDLTESSASMPDPNNHLGPNVDADNTSNHVYIRDKEYAWIPARVVEQDGTTVVVSVPQYRDEQDIQSDGGRAAERNVKQSINLNEYPNQSLLLQNVDERGNLRPVQDMVDLPFLHEAAILYNLKKRHHACLPYTRTGDIVIACNPYQWFDHLYDESTRQHYSRSLVWTRVTGDADPRLDLEPHVYEASALAYRGLAVDGQDQSILVSGESGAGKTESVKICLHHIASVQRGVRRRITGSFDEDDSFGNPIVQRVLDSNPLLEAFGNAKTIRNDNSSRFGKYVTLQFETEDMYSAAYAGKNLPGCVLAGSKCDVYLLEKSRVVHHVEDERTFHIFYQLLASDDEVKAKFWKGLESTDNESFAYVGYTETDMIEGMSDAERFRHTLDSLALVGVKDEKLHTLIQAICIVLQLGNIMFEVDPEDESRSVITTTNEFNDLAELMGISPDDLRPALTIRTVRARNEEFKVPLRAPQAKDSTDAFAKEIYAKTFLWLVRAINDATCAERNYDQHSPFAAKQGRPSSTSTRHRKYGMIGLLDIFGFEVFETNRFEQLCINYANEKLQQKFTQDIFRSVQLEYENEGIELEEIRYDDNTDVLDLVEGRMGLLAVLNEECVRPGGSDKAFVGKIYQMNKDNEIFVRENTFDDTEFGVRHYAGKVIYDAEGFVTKNTDTLPTDLQDCATHSTNDIIANELQNESTMNPDKKSKSGLSSPKKPSPKKSSPKNRPATKHGKKKAPAARRQKSSNLVGETVWTKFRGQLNKLMGDLSKTRTRYIRCIKPNEFKEPLVMQHQSTVEQLRCAGVVAAVTISRSAFPNRLEHEIVIDRFKSLWDRKEHQIAEKKAFDEEDEEEKVRILAEALLKTALKPLETSDGEQIVRAFVIGKSRTYFRAGALERLEGERLKRLGVWAIGIQSQMRGFLCRRDYRRMRFVAIRMQAYTRCSIAVKSFRAVLAAAVRVECWLRRVNAKRNLVILRRKVNAARIQALWRMIPLRVTFKERRKAIVPIQTMVRGGLQRPKYRFALHEKREEAKLANKVAALQRKLEEAEQRRIEGERAAKEQMQHALEAAQKESEEKKESELAAEREAAAARAAEEAANAAQQNNLMDESGKMLEYLRKEVFKLRSQNTQLRTDFDLLKDNNQRLMDANASAGASFAALNQHAKQLTRTNEKLTSDLTSSKQQVQKLSVTQIELKEELKMKQATYVAEVHSRLQYQKALSKIVDFVQERCRDSRLVEDILSVADDCEAEYMKGPTGMDRKSLFSTPDRGNNGNNGTGNESATGLMSSFRSLWS